MKTVGGRSAGSVPGPTLPPSPATAGGRLGPRVVMLVLAAVLLAAAGLKAHQLSTSPVIGKGLLNQRWFLAALTEFELVLGVWLLSGLYRRLAWAVTVACFLAFTAAAFQKGLAGESSCGCFGKLPVPPWVMLIVDVFAVAMLVYWRPDLRRPAAAVVKHFRLRLAGSAGLAAAAGIPIALAMAAYQPGAISETGEILGEGRFVVLNVGSWRDKPLPLLRHVDIGEKLAQGKWTAILYHHDCPYCQEQLPKCTETAKKAGAQRIAFVEMSPYAPAGKGIAPTGPQCIHGKLSSIREWVVQTPAVVVMDSAIVISAQEAKGDVPLSEGMGRFAFPKTAPVVPVASAAGGHDFGFVGPGTVHYVAFNLRNPAGTPLKLRKVHSECGCMQVVDPPAVIPAGGEAAVKVRLAAPKKTLTYSKRVIVLPEGNRPAIALQVSARVGLPLEAEPKTIDLGMLVVGEQRQAFLTVVNHGDKAVRPVYGTSTLAGCLPKVPRADVPPGGRLAIPIEVRAAGTSAMTATAATETGTVRIQTDSDKQPTVEAQVRYGVSRAYRLSRGVIDLGAVAPGQKRTAILEVVSSGQSGPFVKSCRPAELRGFLPLAPAAAAAPAAGEIAVTTTGRSALIQCTFTAGQAEGPLGGKIILELADHGQPVEVPIVGQVTLKPNLVAQPKEPPQGKEAS